MRPRLILPSLRKLPMGQCLALSFDERPKASIGQPRPSLACRKNGTIERRTTETTIHLVLGSGIPRPHHFVNWLACRIRATRKGQRFGDFFPGGYTRPNPQGMVLGGAMTLIGFFVGVLTLDKTLLAAPLGTLDALNPRQRLMVVFLYLAAVAGAIMSIEMWPYLVLVGFGFFIHLFVRYS